MRSILALALLATPAEADIGDLPPLTDWYENPLGVSPLQLHTANALLLPAVAAAICLLATDPPAEREGLAWFGDFGLSRGYYPPFTTVAQANAGVLYSPRPWLTLGAGLDLYRASDDFNQTWGFGARPFVRWNVIRGDRVRVFFESGAGLIVFTDRFPGPTSGFGELSDPRSGTHLNGSPQYGAGIEVRLDARWWVVAGVRHVHVSNGNTIGADRNPGHDSNGGFVGVTIR